MDVIEIDASTGEAIARQYTAAEAAQRDADSAAAAATEAALADQATRRDALLTRLGLSEDEVTLLFTRLPEASP